MAFKILHTNKKFLALGLGLVFLFVFLPSVSQAIVSPVWDEFQKCSWLTPWTCFNSLFLGLGKLFEVLIMIPIWLALGPIIGTIAIGSLIGIFGSFIFYAIASLLLTWVTTDAFVSLSFTHGGIVGPGLEVTTSLVNMIFILVLVFIAFATILRLENYGLKKLLPKFLAVVLLINFIPVITGMVIDIANIVTDSFLTPNLNEQFLTVWVAGMPIVGDFYNSLTEGGDYACLEGGELTCPSGTYMAGKKLTCEQHACTPGETISCGIDPSAGNEITSLCPANGRADCYTVSCASPIGNSFLAALDSLMQSFLTLSGFMGMLVKAAGITFFGFFAGLVILLYVLLFMIRIIALWILVILAPIAWFCWILPNTQNVFKMWWSYFLQWAFVGAIAGFFLWLAGGLVGALGRLTPITMAAPEGPLALLSPIISTLNWFFVFGTVIAFLIIGFILSIKTSSRGTEILLKGAERGGKAAGKVLGQRVWQGKEGKGGIKAEAKAIGGAAMDIPRSFARGVEAGGGWKTRRGWTSGFKGVGKTLTPPPPKQWIPLAKEYGKYRLKPTIEAARKGTWDAIKDSTKAGWMAGLGIKAKKKGKAVPGKTGWQKCPTCDQEIAASAKTCPKCGAVLAE